MDITVHGVGTHGASPHLGVDPVLVASQIVVSLQSLRSRETSPLEGAVVTVGAIHGGIKHNIISDRVDMQLTVRADSPEVRTQLLDGIDRIARNTALALGVPDPTQDALMDKTYPIEADFDLLNGIDFHKGCFIGQETTSRMKRRGTIKNRMMPLSFDGAPFEFGAEVLNGELRAGQVLSGQDGLVMALLRVDRVDGDLTVDGRPVRLHRPGWMGEEAPSSNA